MNLRPIKQTPSVIVDMLPRTGQLVPGSVVWNCTIKHNGGDTQVESEEDYAHHKYSGTQSGSRGGWTPNDVDTLDWKKWIVSGSPPSGYRKLTEEEIYKELGGPIEYDAKIDTERARRCAGSHPNTEDQDASGEKEEPRVEKDNQDTEPRP